MGRKLLIAGAFFLVFLSVHPRALASHRPHSLSAPLPEKEWTLLVFINGHNNLDSYGGADVNEMERIGSTENANIIVQWASAASKTTKRLWVQQDQDMRKVNSPVLEELPRVDMGDYRNLTEFLQWGMHHFPAKKYFVDVWDHGSGWHNMKKIRSGNFRNLDISYDDFTGSVITTKQLGDSLRQVSQTLGRKIEVLGLDACLMAMLEVATEVQDSVQYLAASQELEPGEGWPYDQWMKTWALGENISAANITKSLAETYLSSYSNGSQGKQDVTFSVLDLSHLSSLQSSIKNLGKLIQTRLTPEEIESTRVAAEKSQYFYYSDYRDLGDFLNRLPTSSTLQASVLETKEALERLVISTRNSPPYVRASGASIWLTTSGYSWNAYQDEYRKLRFQDRTDWATTVNSLLR